ncbi:MAG: mercuric transporter MerT family protein [Rhodospirillaceae bacterium]|nr:mercuric transporter MerT family protein [Rhodospirillaceae bacterium]
MEARILRIAVAGDGRPQGAVVGLAALLALLSASCCVLPIALSIIGLGGAWLAVLGPFVAYRMAILVGVGLVLVWAWFRILRRRRSGSRQGGAVALATVATLSFVLAAASPAWEGDAVRILMDAWRTAR